MTFKQYSNDTKGNVATMFGISLLVFIAAIGSAIDYARLISTNSKLQSLSDSLTLAAAIGWQEGQHDETGLDEFARIYLAANDASHLQAAWEMEGGELNFTLQTTQEMIFMGIFNQSEKIVGATSSVPVLKAKNFNVALVLDSTLSMTGTRMLSLKRAANEMIDVIRTTDSDDTYVSVVPFSEMVKIPTSYGNASWFNKPADKTVNQNLIDLNLSIGCRIETTGEKRQRVCDHTVLSTVTLNITWNGCMISRNFGYHNVPEFSAQRLQGVTRTGYCSDDRNMMSPMTNNMDTVAATVDAMVPHSETYIPGGLIWGWRTLQSEAPLTEIAQAPADNEKVMIVMTDGANSNSLGNPVPWSDGLFHDESDVVAANTLTSELCEDIKNDDVEIYTIALEVNDAATVTMMQNCATSAAHFYDVSNASGLSEVFESISTELADIRLSN